MQKRFSFPPLPRTALAIAAAAALALSGCAGSSGSGTPAESYAASGQTGSPSNASSDAASEQARFDAFLAHQFQESVQDDPLSLHFLVRNPENYGITEPEMKFPEYSLEQLQKDSEENATVLEELSSFDTSLLTSDQLFTYRMMKDTLETEAGSKGLELYNQPLSALIGTQAELPTLLAEYTFYNRADIDHYLALLSQIDTYYKQLAAYEQAQADAGLAPSDDTIDRILKSCKSYLIRPENSLLTETFASRLNAVEGLSDAEKASYKAKHLTILKEHFIPAYTNLSKALESLKGSHPETGGLSTYEHGREYYAYLAAALTGTDSSVDALKTRIEKQMQADLSEIRVRLKEHPELIRQMTDSAITLSDPDEILQNLQVQIQDDFPALTDTSYTLKYVPEALESSLSPAFFLVPPIDSDGSNTIYINEKASTEQNLYTMLAHEGYPGHLYQTVYSSLVCDTQTLPIRKLFSYGGYVEGWAYYTERISYEYAAQVLAEAEGSLGSSYPAALLCTLLAQQRDLQINLFCLLDLSLHYYGAEESELLRSLESFGLSEEQSERIYDYLRTAPAVYLKYYVGYLEMNALKKRAELQWSDNFSLLRFHRFVLEAGPSDFENLTKRLKQTAAKTG